MTDGEKVSVVVITGPIGVGKTTTAERLGEALTSHDVPNTVIDMDWLRVSYPRPTDDPFQTRLGFRNLGCVAQNSMAAGSTRIAIADVVESRDQREEYLRAIPGSDVRIVRLTARMDTVHDRITHRARGAGDPWEHQRSVELVALMDANDVADVTIDTTGRSPEDVAREIADWLGWLPPELAVRD